MEPRRKEYRTGKGGHEAKRLPEAITKLLTKELRPSKWFDKH
jgi:hypothetical protein